MKKIIGLLLICMVLFNSTTTVGQNIDAGQLNTINIDKLSDEAIANYWEQAKSKGYTLDQLEALAKVKGVSSTQFSKIRQRIQQLNLNQNSNSIEIDEVAEEDITMTLFGLTGEEDKSKQERNLLFGYDFFNNPNISFTPSINVATPKNYQLGPGDELLIDIWGAAENSYQKRVNKQGNIRIESIGMISVSGLSLEKATSKINSYLKRIYAGIGASKSSYNKVYTDISLSKIRTVQVNIIGEVKVPGTYSLNALSTVLNALYASGGPTENGTFRNIALVRNGTKVANFDIYQFLIHGSEEGNLKLRDQDVLIVKPYQHLVTVEGEVKRPGIYELKNDETFDNLITYFSGFTPQAYTHLLVVERVNGKQKEVKEVQLSEASNFKLQGGDKIIVNEIIDKFKNRISISGAVYRPGNYEFTPKMTLYHLIKKADGVRDEAFLQRGLLIRSYDETEKEAIAFSVTDVLKQDQRMLLKEEDSIHIYHKEELREKLYVTIDGAVNKAQQFDFVNKMQIEDVIAMAGGLKEGADPTTIHVSRRLKDGSFETLSENFKLASTNTLAFKNGSSFYLEPFDIISVRYLKGYTAQKKITIKGEVNFPGNYAISDKNERISDVIERAGGLNSYAYLKGATLLRKKQALEDELQLDFVEILTTKDSLLNDEELVQPKEFKIGINLEEIMHNGGRRSDIDLIVEEGDVLIIPSERQTIEVQGEVLFPSLVRFEAGRSLKHYITSSGGFSEKAKKNKVYVIYANGDIRTVQNFVFFRSYPKLAPGAMILVPSKKMSNNRMSIAEIIGITTSLATLGVLINTLK